MTTPPPVFDDWLRQLEARHLANLRVPEVTRALRALSSAYVERRHKVAAGATLDSEGKRAAFALFYAPLHFLAAFHVIRAIDAPVPPATAIVDLGCGTGAAGAACALASENRPRVTGIDRHPWAVSEARWTYSRLGVDGHARQGDLTRVTLPRRGGAVVAAYAFNELPVPVRLRIESQLLSAMSEGVRSLVLEPLSRSVSPWWDATAQRVIAAGGRVDEWRVPVALPPLLQLFDRAAGLKHDELTMRSMYLPAV